MVHAVNLDQKARLHGQVESRNPAADGQPGVQRGIQPCRDDEVGLQPTKLSPQIEPRPQGADGISRSGSMNARDAVLRQLVGDLAGFAQSDRVQFSALCGQRPSAEQS